MSSFFINNESVPLYNEIKIIKCFYLCFTNFKTRFQLQLSKVLKIYIDINDNYYLLYELKTISLHAVFFYDSLPSRSILLSFSPPYYQPVFSRNFCLFFAFTPAGLKGFYWRFWLNLTYTKNCMHYKSDVWGTYTKLLPLYFISKSEPKNEPK